jgi:hypothetical protein
MIDHVIYAAPDLERAVDDFAREYGVRCTPGGRHAGFGTRNALTGLGSGSYLEIMAIDPGQDVPPDRRLFALDADFTPRFVSWCARAARPLEETAAIAHAAGADLGEIIAMSRVLPDGREIAWRVTQPMAGREGGVLPLYIDWGTAPHPSAGLPAALRLESLTAIHPDAPRIRSILDALGETTVAVEAGPRPGLRVILARSI